MCATSAVLCPLGLLRDLHVDVDCCSRACCQSVHFSLDTQIEQSMVALVWYIGPVQEKLIAGRQTDSEGVCFS